MIKTLFWTSLFWIFIISGAYGFIRYIASDTIKDLVLPRSESVSTSGNVNKTTELDALREGNSYLIQQIDKLSQQIGNMDRETITPGILPTTRTETQVDTENTSNTPQESTINLFYFNEKIDKKLPVRSQLNTSSIQAVQRTINTLDTIESKIEAAVNLLLEGGLTADETRDGFVSDFPKSLTLKSVEYNEYEIAILTFSLDANDDINGSARVILLEDAIKKTVEQFDGVRSTIISPDGILQP